MNTFEIDLSLGDFTVCEEGIYRIIDGSPNKVVFPDPLTMEGKVIHVLNNTGNEIETDGSHPRRPGDQVVTFMDQSSYTIVSIKGVWVLFSEVKQNN